MMGRNKTQKIPVPHKSKLKKDPGIPRLPDLKAKKAEKERPKPFHARLDPDAVMASEPTLSTLAMLATQQSNPSTFQDPKDTNGKTKEQIKKHYLRTLHKVVDQSDIIILVLDARDPEGCRSRLVEEEVRRREAEGKKLLFVLNKVDLVPKQNAQQWLRYLRHSTPTLPFLSPSSPHHQRTNISSATAPALVKLLKAYKPKAGSVTVGVVGYPNVGKSSLINALKRSKVCAVASQPGHTKSLQSVQLERGIRIIDSPGVVFDDDDESVNGKSRNKGSVLLRNVVKVEDVDDPIAVVEEIFVRTPKETLEKIYGLPEFESTLEFLTMLALSSGRLLKGGTPDITGAARHVIQDWNHQKIPYFSEPPAVHPSLIPSTLPSSSSSSQTPTIAPGAENVGQAKIVQSFSKPFELEGLFGVADDRAFNDDSIGGGGDGGEGEGGDVRMDEDGDVFYDAVEDMDEDGLGDELRNPRKRSRSSSALSRSTTNDSDLNKPTITSTNLHNPTNSTTTTTSQPSPFIRQPKRQRRNKDIPEYDSPMDEHVLVRMARSNPMNRRVVKRERKRERRAGRVRGAGAGGGGGGGNGEGGRGGGGGGMEVDDEGLEFTFMV